MKLTASGRKDKIDHDEEYFLRITELQDELKCPILEGIWEAFYNGPRISSNQAESIALELDAVNLFLAAQKDSSVDLSQWAKTYSRLREFFVEAHRLGSTVECMSD